MNVSDFDFELPPELIAQEAPEVRGTSRLLALDRGSGRIAHHHFFELPQLLEPGDLLVVNDTRVFPARLIGTRLPGGGAAECLLLRPERRGARVSAAGGANEERWIALVHPGQRLRDGSRMSFGRLQAEVIGRHFHGRRTVRLWTEDGSPVRDAIDAIGHVPLPPYIRRADAASDRERYQTVYARERGSIAAPTAGLHFTPALFHELADRGIEQTNVTLHVGYGTFQPVRVERVADHRMESEYYEVSAASAEAVSRAKRDRRRIIAVGTTSTRTLESLAWTGAALQAGSGETSLFIYPGHQFQAISGMITNFHLPQSSLLMLVCAFGGTSRVLAAYREAIARRYRFYSYGDAMIVL